MHKIELRAVAMALTIVMLLTCGLSECVAQGKKPKPARPEPKGPERELPSWTDTSGTYPEDKKEARKATVFEHFAETAGNKMAKPILIYFYWPDEGKPDRIALACASFEKNLSKASNFHDAAGEFGSYKCNLKNVDKKLIAKFKLKAPCILIFNATGKKVASIAKFPKNDKSLAKKLNKIKTSSDKAVEKAQKKKEKDKKSP